MRTASKIAIVLSLLLSPWVMRAQTAVISGQVIDQNGKPLPNAQVRVCSVTSTGDPCTPVASIFYDFNLTLPAPNPYGADEFGNYTVYVGALPAPNLYEVQLVPKSGTTWTYVSNGPSLSAGGGTVTGPITATLFNATTFPYFEINGVQISSAALSDAGTLAKLTANTFTGTQTAPIFNATSEFTVNGAQIACVNLSDCGNLAKINASNNFTGTLQTVQMINANGGYQYQGTAALNHLLLGNGNNYVDSATIPYGIISGAPGAPFSGAGVIPFTTSTTTSGAANSSQIVGVLNTAPSSVLSTALLPVANSSTVGVVRPDNTTITISGGVLSVATALTAIDYYWTVAGCETPVSQPSRCQGTTTLPANMPDANYQVFCSTNDIANGSLNGSTVCSLYNGGVLPTSSATAMTYQVLQVIQNSPGGGQPTLYFHAHHN